MKADVTKGSEEALTSPETDQPRTRGGLAKLRGEPVVAPPAPAAAPDRDEQPASGVVTLTKPAAEPELAPAAPEGEVPEAPRVGPSRRILAAIVALIVAIGVLLPLALNNPFDSGSKSSSTATGGNADERLAVVRSARQFTVSFFTYDYRNMDAYFKRIEAASSGAFRTDFVSKEKTLKTVVTELKTVATGQVPDTGAGLFQLNGDKATALIAANFNASNAVTKNGQKRYRVKIALQRIKGVWLVTNFDQVV
jgi:hypothetical protein